MNAQATPPRDRFARKLVIDLAIMTVIGIVLAFIGPFGSFAEPLAYRLASWVSFAWVGYAIYSPMNWLVDRLYEALELPRSALWVLGVALATIPMTAIVWAMGFLPSRPVPIPTLEQALTSYFYVFLVGGGITAFFYMIEARQQAGVAEILESADDSNPPVGPQAARTQSTAPPSEAHSGPRLIDRLPPELGSDILALEMEDHYVRVHTALGSELILLRLRDAMEEMDGIEGKQVHRSWWVARDAVDNVVREGRNVRLRLARSIEAPVSRANVSVLKDAGWI